MEVSQSKGASTLHVQNELGGLRIDPLRSRRISSITSQRVEHTSGGLIGYVRSAFQSVVRFVASIGVFLRNIIFCCCARSKVAEKKIDWIELKELFSAIYDDVTDNTDDVSDRQKRFGRAVDELPEKVAHRFKEHIAFAVAEDQSPPITTQAEKEKYARENWELIEFEEYLGDITSSAVKRAAEGFHKEIEERALQDNG